MKPFIVDLIETRVFRIRVDAIDSADASERAEEEYWNGAEYEVLDVPDIEVDSVIEDI